MGDEVKICGTCHDYSSITTASGDCQLTDSEVFSNDSHPCWRPKGDGAGVVLGLAVAGLGIAALLVLVSGCKTIDIGKLLPKDKPAVVIPEPIPEPTPEPEPEPVPFPVPDPAPAVNGYRIVDDGAESDCLAMPYGRLASIAVDSRGQPHIVADGGTFAYFADRVDGQWINHAMNVGSIYSTKQYYNPHIEIDSKDRAWYSGILFGNDMGMAFLIRDGIDSATTSPDASRFTRSNVMPYSWPVGLMSLDPGKPDEMVAFASQGYYQRFAYGPQLIAGPIGGKLWAYNGGEKNGFWISKAGDVLHNDGNHAVWHACTDTGYQNSIRAQYKDFVNWCSWEVYSGMGLGDDGAYVSVHSPLDAPLDAYLAVGIPPRYGGGKCLVNVWRSSSDGTGGLLAFQPGALLDMGGSSGAHRYAPQWAAGRGGCWLAYQTYAGAVRVVYVPRGVSSMADCGPSVEFPGNTPAICVDAAGDLHVAYQREGIRYRKIAVEVER